MSKSADYGWKGCKVRNIDGRAGIVRRERPDFMGVELVLEVEGGGEARVQLNANFPDTGEAGWSWYCDHFDGAAAWLPLGSHAGVGIERVEKRAA